MRLPLLLAPLAPGCTGGRDCTLLACGSGVELFLTGFAAAHSGDLPLTLTVCVGSACSSVQLTATGASPVCMVKSAGTTGCSIDGTGRFSFGEHGGRQQPNCRNGAQLVNRNDPVSVDRAACRS